MRALPKEKSLSRWERCLPLWGADGEGSRGKMHGAGELSCMDRPREGNIFRAAAGAGGAQRAGKEASVKASRRIM